MKNFVVEIASQTASFRDPNFQNYHKSLELPPPTTIIGMCGAALGLSPLQAQEFFDKANLQIGIYGDYKGKCQDTWKYKSSRKINMRHYNPGLDGSIIQKEYLIENRFFIAFSADDSSALERLKSAFENPVYALTMGNSDSLAKILTIKENVDKIESDRIQNVFLPGDVVDEVMSLAEKGDLAFSIYSNDTLTYDLPVRFDYKNDYGKRSISEVKTFSLIGDAMKLNYKISGLIYKSIFIPMFDL